MDMAAPMSFEDFIFQAEPETNVIILDGKLDQHKYRTVYYKLDYIIWDDVESLGPVCYLCDEIIEDITDSFTFKGTTYSIVLKDHFNVDDPNKCALQCVHCLNFYHKNK